MGTKFGRVTRRFAVLGRGAAFFADSFSGSLADFDGTATAVTLRKAINVGKWDLHGIDVATAYLLALENEATNIRLIAHAVNFGIPDSYVERELIIV